MKGAHLVPSREGASTTGPTNHGTEARQGPLDELVTPRLRLRNWTEADAEPFAQLNADPVVMQHLLGPMTRARSDAQLEQYRRHAQVHGFGRWAVQLKDDDRFIGMAGLSLVPYAAPFTPAVELTWRLARALWGKGLATEAAWAAAHYGFERLGLPEIVAVTVPSNLRSRAVMQRLGMACDPADAFAHPLLAPDHPLSRHFLHRLKAADFAPTKGA